MLAYKRRSDRLGPSSQLRLFVGALLATSSSEEPGLLIRHHTGRPAFFDYRARREPEYLPLTAGCPSSAESPTRLSEPPALTSQFLRTRFPASFERSGECRAG